MTSLTISVPMIHGVDRTEHSSGCLRTRATSLLSLMLVWKMKMTIIWTIPNSKQVTKNLRKWMIYHHMAILRQCPPPGRRRVGGRTFWRYPMC